MTLWQGIFGATDNLCWKILCCAGYPVHCRMFCSILGLNLLDAINMPSPAKAVITKYVAKHGQICPQWEASLVENHYSKENLKYKYSGEKKEFDYILHMKHLTHH